jgi:RNA polymerase sigma factor (sigma-70 family)
MPMTTEELEAFFTVQFPILARILVLGGASKEEAEDAAQKAMIELYERLQPGKKAIENPAAWVRRAAISHFVRERERDRERLPRAIKGGHLAPQAYADDELTAWEEEQLVARFLEKLTPTQHAVLALMIEGMTTPEIAEALGKKQANIRQQLKNARDQLKLDPEIAARAPQASRAPASLSTRSLVKAPDAAEVTGQ